MALFVCICQLLRLLTEVVAVNWSSRSKPTLFQLFSKVFHPDRDGGLRRLGCALPPTLPGSKLNKSLILKILNSFFTDKGWLEGGLGFEVFLANATLVEVDPLLILGLYSGQRRSDYTPPPEQGSVVYRPPAGSFSAQKVMIVFRLLVS